VLPGLKGRLVSQYFAEHLLAAEFWAELGEESRDTAQRRFKFWWELQKQSVGPASSERAIRESVAVPLAELLGFDRSPHHSVLIFTGLWNSDLDTLWRDAVHSSIGADADWCLCTNGHQLRLIDARRTYSRAYLEFDLAQVFEDSRVFAVFWGLLRAEGFRDLTGKGPLVRRIIQQSARHGAAVGRSLRAGVIQAVSHLMTGLAQSNPHKGRHAQIPQIFDEALTIVYRVLFLMFAESRGLVPNWHPVYRDHYTIEALRDQAEAQAGEGLWEALQAIGRLAHAGCHAGTLTVAAFNGRLFSPTHAPLAERVAVNDVTTREALIALSTSRETGKARTRIDYRDLGVEQLGAVYEAILDYVPRTGTEDGQAVLRLERGGVARKSSGSFYTPQSLTDCLVRRTLYPLVRDASSDQILALRVLDPAMGSGAFLVTACRFLARAYEQALVREGLCPAQDVTDVERAMFRRMIAQRCLFGVDLNPTAVQLARLSLWLATLAADRPLTFLDHHLVAGDSLIGASIADITRQPPGRVRTTSKKTAPLTLFADDQLETSFGALVRERSWLSETPDDQLQVVRDKERRLQDLIEKNRWRAAADLWCACWMWPDRTTAPAPSMFQSLADAVVHDRRQLPDALLHGLLATAKNEAEKRRFVHWTLEFPEVFFDTTGQPLARPGFDAVIGNPPWDVLRADSGEEKAATRADVDLMKRFVRDSSIYRLQGAGHMNRYQLFLERAMSLVRSGGRLGMVLPSGLALDRTCSALRRHLLERHCIDTFVQFDNRRAIFPIHRSLRFVMCTATAGQPTQQFDCICGVDDPALLDGLPEERSGERLRPVRLNTDLLRRLTGETLAIPDFRSAVDVQIAERIAAHYLPLSDPAGWGATFGRELNVTDDRRFFHLSGPGIAVLEGKHIEPFAVNLSGVRWRIRPQDAKRLLGIDCAVGRPRLAYRDVASVTNRLSLIAAIIPAHTVTVHTLFCLKTRMRMDDQLFLCAMMNSFVVNYLVRQVMITHLGSTLVESLRIPKPAADDSLRGEMTRLVRRGGAGAPEDMARLQALAGRIYNLSVDEFRHIVASFPLVPAHERRRALEIFSEDRD